MSIEEELLNDEYTVERLEREERIEKLFDELRELAEHNLKGTFSSDGLLNAACTLYAAEANVAPYKPTREVLP